MTRRLIARHLAGAPLLALLAGCGGMNGTSGVVVDRYDASLSVLADGSLDILEAVIVRAQGPADGRFVRDLPRTNVDQILDADASLDGGPITTSGGQLQLDRSGALRATWPVPGAGSGSHRLTLHYRLAGALFMQGPRGVLRWPALPPDRSYVVTASRLDLALSPGTEFAAGPELESRAGSLTRRSDGATAELASIAPGDSILISADIDMGLLRLAEPQWQYDAERARDLMPAFLSAGICLAAIGIGIIVMIRLQYPATPTDPGSPAETTLEAIAPAMEAALATGRLGDRAMVADLVACGLVDAERLSAARGLRISSVVAAVLAAAGAVVMNLTLARFGIWPMSVPTGLFVVSALFLWTGFRMPVWSEAGERARARARQRQ